MATRKLPKIVIVGRPNVGKSSIFNRILGRRQAIVGEMPGVTRDGVSAKIDWNRKSFILSDSAGVTFEDEHFQKKVIHFVKRAIEEADLLLFVVEPELTVLDEEVAMLLRRSSKPSVVAVNKIDNPKKMWQSALASELGFDEIMPISATAGLGIGDLLDKIIEEMPEAPIEDEKIDISISIVGRPNVGKSTLLNRIIGDEKVLVDNTPGTTRDAIDIGFNYYNKHLTLIDTAGILKKQQGIQYYSSIRSKQAIHRSDVSLLLVDAIEGIGRIEKIIANEIISNYNGIIILVNKWDIYEDKDSNTAERFRGELLYDAGFLKLAPIIFISAKTGKNIHRVLNKAIEVFNARQRRIKTSELNKFFEYLYPRLPGSGFTGTGFKYITQVSTEPPHFVLFHKNPKKVPKSWHNQIKNAIREEYDFHGVPIKISVKAKK
ncbi:MAG: ribosome biogenesis GTPase Der [Candidatus Zixiibacteriota bacterium]